MVEIVSREVCGLCRTKLHHAPTKDQMCRNVSRETILISADQIWFTFVRPWYDGIRQNAFRNRFLSSHRCNFLNLIIGAIWNVYKGKVTSFFILSRLQERIIWEIEGYGGGKDYSKMVSRSGRRLREEAERYSSRKFVKNFGRKFVSKYSFLPFGSRGIAKFFVDR